MSWIDKRRGKVNKRQIYSGERFKNYDRTNAGTQKTASMVNVESTIEAAINH